jgi:hypothetical protein
LDEVESGFGDVDSATAEVSRVCGVPDARRKLGAFSTFDEFERRKKSARSGKRISPLRRRKEMRTALRLR